VTPRSISPFLFAALLALLGIGCNRDCEDICEDIKDCDNGDKSIDCATNCESTKKLNELAGCEDQYEELLNCEGNTDDICRVGDSCEAQQNKWSTCRTAYCKDHPDDCD